MGASRDGPGLSGHRVHMGNTMNLPIEAVEAGISIRIDAYELIDGSGGRGINPGGMGARRVVRALVDGVQFSLLFERAFHPAKGASGGEAGRAARFYVRRSDSSQQELGSKTLAGQLNAGDVLYMETAGGGGWGSGPSAVEQAN